MNKKCFFVAALLVIYFAQLLVAQNGAPTARRGFKLDYGVSLPNGVHGKIPIRLRLTRVPAVPAINDESFNVSVSSGWDTDAGRSSSTSEELIIAAGRTSAEVELLFDDEGRNGCTFLVERGGRHTNSIGNDLFHEYINGMRNADAGDASWLLISSNVPKRRFTNKLVYYSGQPVAMTNSRYTVPTFNRNFGEIEQITGLKKIFGRPLNQILNRTNWHALPPAELPESWVGLTSIDYVLISNDEFKSLAKVPAYREIIEQWVAAGGCLIVFNASNSLSHAASVFPTLLGAERARPDRLWAAVGPNEIASHFRTQSLYGKKQPDFKPAKSLNDKDQLAVSPYLDGTVGVMVRPEKLSRLITGDQFLGRHTATNQYAMSSNSRQQSAIPGVGKPPLALFGVFTGVFLFLIGPVILMIVSLNNDRRFLFFLVPVLSFVTCTSILGYAIVADFNKQLGRTDTVTNLDSQAGYAFSQASSAYYCGSQPPHYAYDTDTLVQTTVDQESGYRIRQLPEENQLSSPRIAPRRLHEVFTAKPYPTRQRFLVAESADQPGVPKVTNLLGSRIERAFFKYGGKSYLVRDLSPKQTTLGIETPLEDCRKELRETVADRQVPGGSAFFAANSSGIRAAINDQQTGTFVAVVDFNPAVEPLIEPFNYKLQLHVVHGKYN